MSPDLLKLDMYSRKVCIGMVGSYCCDTPVTEKERFKIHVIRDGDSSEGVIIEYPMFDINNEDQMCVLLDSEMGTLCRGRYLFKIIFDECVTIGKLKFLWAGKPVITSVNVDSSPFEDCVDSCDTTSKLPPADECCAIEEPKSCVDLNPDSGC